MLSEDTWLWVRSKDLYYSWPSRQHKLHIHISPLVPQSPTEVRQRMQFWPWDPEFTKLRSLGASSKTAQNVFPKGDIIFIIPFREEICPLPQREILSLSLKAVCYKNILKKIVWRKSSMPLCKIMCRNIREPLEVCVSSQNTFPNSVSVFYFLF